MKTKTLFLSLLLLVPLAGCNKEQSSGRLSPSEEQQMGTISIQLCGQDSGTKALSAYTQAQDYETQINSVQLLIFDDYGDLIKDLRYTSSFTSMQTTVPTGNYDIYAVVNKTLENVTSPTEFDGLYYNVNLEDNVIADKNFVMCGMANCTVTGSSTTSCPITVSRVLARVALNSVKVQLPEGWEVMFESAFLSNVCGECCVNGYPVYDGYYFDTVNEPRIFNYDGYDKLTVYLSQDFRIDVNDRSTIWCANDAQHPTLTAFDMDRGKGIYYASGSTWTRTWGGISHILLYGCPSNYTTDPNGAHTYYEDQKTCLVLSANIATAMNDRTTYYVIPLDSFEANKTYTIDLTITGLGTDDPNMPVKKGNMTASVTVSGWSTGDVIEKTI